MANSRRRLVALFVTALVGTTSWSITAPAQASGPVPTPIPADAPWLSVVNYYRAMSGLAPVSENPVWSQGAWLHSCYMLRNGISHDEIPGRPGYTEAGRAAGLNGNVAITSASNARPRRHIELWMTGPFHAIGILRHNLVQVGYGQCDQSDGTPWRSAATLDILRGLDLTRPRPSWPILFPGDGTTTNLDRFITESPNPLTFCGWPSGGGLPVMALLPESFSTASSSMTGPNGPLQVCTLHQHNTWGVASQLLAGDNAVVVMPRNPLTPGTYRVNVTTNRRTVSWSFTVDPTVANGTVTPVPTTSVVGPASGYRPLLPARLVDTRRGLGATRLIPNVPVAIQVTGRAGVPLDATALSANFTAMRGSALGYLTAYPCGAGVPTVATLNFEPGQIVPNAAVVPLDASGRLCVVSNTAVDLVIDVNGALTPSATGSFVSIAPTRLFDTRSRHRAPGRLPAGGQFSLNVKQAGVGVPAAATAVVLNVGAHRPASLGFITIWPCGSARPTVASLNPNVGEIRPNMVIVPLPEDGRICFYTEGETDLFGDLSGYVVDSGAGLRFRPLNPIRLTDTRDRTQSALNLGLGGFRLREGTAVQIPVSGVRGIPSDAKAISINITALHADGRGYVTAFPCASSVPFAATLNLQPGRAVANAANIGLSPGGSLCVYSTHHVHLIIDINGFWS